MDKEVTVNGNINVNNYSNQSGDVLKGAKDIVVFGNLIVNGNIDISTNGSAINGSIKQNIG